MYRLAFLLTGILLMPVATAAQTPDTASANVRIGMIGLDTSHSPAFAELFNTDEALGDFRVVAAYPYGSRTIASSYERIPRYTEAVRAMGVEIVDSIEALLERVDVVLLETNDGRLHLEQALPVIEAGKPLFIDKPMAASLADVLAIFEAAEHYGVPVFSASSLRFEEAMQDVRGGSIGRVVGADAYSPARLEPTHPDLFWYGIHGVETLFTVMGAGCERVRRVHDDSTDVVVGTWADGRIGTFRGLRSGEYGYGGTAFGTDSIAVLDYSSGYAPLVEAIADFFRTGEVPVPSEETVEIFAFMAAAEESKRQGGAAVALADVLAQAREKAAQRWSRP